MVNRLFVFGEEQPDQGAVLAGDDDAGHVRVVHAVGQVGRHRLNTGGNRQLNSALHTIAVCQARDPGPGRVYYLRKLSEGKTPAEARRALKRRLANVIYRHIQKDQKRRSAPAT